MWGYLFRCWNVGLCRFFDINMCFILFKFVFLGLGGIVVFDKVGNKLK